MESFGTFQKLIHPEFANLTSVDQVSVIEMIEDAVSDPEFASTYPDSPLKEAIEQIINQPGIQLNALTWGR